MATKPTTHFAIIEDLPTGPRARYTVPTTLDDAAEIVATRVAFIKSLRGNTVTVTTVTH